MEIMGNDSGWEIKGVMLDSARLTESYEFYENLIPSLAKWGYNTIFAHFCDDEGCSIILKNTDVLPTPGAFTIDQWKALVQLAEKSGLTVIPEVECLGHTGYITRLAQNEELREPPLEGIYWSISPIHPRSLQLLKSILEEVNGIFNSPYIHIGMDEADIGGSPASLKYLEEKPKWRLFGDFLNSIHAIVQDLGKKTMCWGDHLLKEERLAEWVSRDIVICNWLYGFDYSENYEGNSRFLLDKGFSIIGCPAGIWNGTMFASNKDNFENLYKYTKVMLKLSLEYTDKILGMINTLWNTYRHLPGILHPPVFYGGRLFNGEDINPDDPVWLNSFVKEEFGLCEKGSDAISRALRLLLIERRRTKQEVSLMPYDKISLSLSQDKVVRYVSSVVLKLANESRSLLEGWSSAITKNRDEYNQWIASAVMIVRISDLAELFHELSPAGPYGDKRRGKNSRWEIQKMNEIISLCKKEVEDILSFWICENRKYRNFLGTRREQVGQDTVFWDIQDSDQPVERLELSLKFLENLSMMK